MCPYTGVEGVHKVPEPVQEAPGGAGKKVHRTSQAVKGWLSSDPSSFSVKTGANGPQGTAWEDGCQPKEEAILCLLSVRGRDCRIAAFVRL